MILTAHQTAIRRFASVARCNQLSLKLYTGFKGRVKFFEVFLFALFLKQCKQKIKVYPWNKTPSWITNWAHVTIRAWRWPTFTRESALSSARSRFTVLFGMGRSGTNLLWSSGITGWRAVFEEQPVEFIEQISFNLDGCTVLFRNCVFLNASTWHNTFELIKVIGSSRTSN